MNEKQIKFSICICNYNMADTLEKSLRSVLNQINEDYEVVVVDDGSNDKSVSIIKELQLEFSSLRSIFLDRDVNRKLGFTRNISIQEALGEWCIFHIDTDDLIGPHIMEFMNGISLLDGALEGKEVLYSGQQIHVARKKFLLKEGPFNNLYRGEDRDLYMRLFKQEAWLIIEHKRFIQRIHRRRDLIFKKVVWDLVDQMTSDLLRDKLKLRELIHSSLARTRGRFREKLARILLIPFVYINVLRADQVFVPTSRSEHPEFVEYRRKHTKTILGHLKDNGASVTFQPSSIFMSPSGDLHGR